jgi:hypothetical protein
MDLENPACKEALGIVPLVIHEETWAKSAPKQPPARVSRTPALCLDKGNCGGLRRLNDPEHRRAGLPSSSFHSLHLALGRAMGC